MLEQVLMDVIEAPSLDSFKIRLEVALDSLIYLKVSMFTVMGLDKMACEASIQPSAICGSGL